ncbi:hypothetical protein GZH47_31455 (plasmid) [Paenibacillus rhizovicinus]|uniref:Uncharacterized protein n=1 Tax=Paenibacillus rhizovicinus TaxID=2704463 RepID=A0A6C0PA99_9BACL|nr:hypothetical protein [Paenibacillus rhizovicinus]QHW35419.1 hypothetical protein GZH47_31455 [Paenibacillus rhizovicinus]
MANGSELSVFPFKVRVVFRGSTKKDLIITINEIGAPKKFTTFANFISYIERRSSTDKEYLFEGYTYAFKAKDVSGYALYAETDDELEKIRDKFQEIEKREDNEYTLEQLFEQIRSTSS